MNRPRALLLVALAAWPSAARAEAQDAGAVPVLPLGTALPLGIVPSSGAVSPPGIVTFPKPMTSPASPTPVGVRFGAHPGFTRIVFDLPGGADAWLTQEAGQVMLRFSGAPAPPLALPIHNLADARSNGESLTLTLRPGARLRTTRLEDRLVVDLQDPAGAADAGAAPPGSARGEAALRRPRPRFEWPVPMAERRDAAVAPVAVVPALAAVPAASPPDPPLVPKESMRGEGVAGAQPAQPANEAARSGRIAELARPARAADVPPAGGAVEGSGTVEPARDRPIGLAVTLTGASDPSKAAVILPFSTAAGAAAFRLGPDAIVVIDERRPLDLAPLHDDPLLGRASIQLLPAATLMRVPLDAPGSVELARRPNGWLLTVRTTASRELGSIRQDVVDGTMKLTAEGAGSVVAVADELTGGRLLVATQKTPGQGVAVGRKLPFFNLLPTWQGVVVEPTSDALSVRSVDQGFSIAAGGEKLALSSMDRDALAQLDTGGFVRTFDLPQASVPTLQRRLAAAIGNAANAPAQSRFQQRMEVAQAMIALGLGAEAQAVLRVAAADDPQAAIGPNLAALSAVAAILASRAEEAGGIDDPRVATSDEITLWRGLRRLASGEDAGGLSASLAAELPLVRSYPEPLRSKLLPRVLQAVALGRESAQVTRLLKDPQSDMQLELARAMALEAAARGGADSAAALGAYDALARGADRWVRAQALARATELRLALGLITPAVAAEQSEQHLYAWRGDEREVASRLRTAEMHRAAGNWRPAIALLKETAAGWPEQRDRVQEQLAATLSEALAQKGREAMSPLDLVTLADENVDLLPGGPGGRALATRLADRLIALDLPKRAIPVLEKLVASGSDAEARADVADRLAGLRLRQDDPAGALRTLDQTDAPGLPADLKERRAMTAARASAATGDVAKASAALAQIGSEQADDLRATLLEKAKDWPAALAAIKQVASRAVPERGALDERQTQVLLRVATIAAEAGDEATLARLRGRDLARIPPGKLNDMMAMLTGQPVHGIADLPVVSREMALARTLPDAARSLTAAVDRPAPPR